MKNQIFNQILAAAARDQLTLKQIRGNFEIIEQEKAVLEEEFGNALTLSEDL